MNHARPLVLVVLAFALLVPAIATALAQDGTPESPVGQPVTEPTPTDVPTAEPTLVPSLEPTAEPSVAPTSIPTDPVQEPTEAPVEATQTPDENTASPESALAAVASSFTVFASAPGELNRIPVVGTNIPVSAGPGCGGHTPPYQTNIRAIDFAVGTGTAVYNPGAGNATVRAMYNQAGAGGIMIELDHGNGLVTYYAHLQGYGNHPTENRQLRVGDVVPPGHRIASSGNTGGSTGPHLHFAATRNGTAVDITGLPTITWNHLLQWNNGIITNCGAPGVAGFNDGYATGTAPLNCSQPLQLVQELAITPTNPVVGQQVRATFAVRNVAPAGCAAYRAANIGVGGRGPNDAIIDFPILANVSISPGQTWSYSQTRTFGTAAAYNFFVYVQDLTVRNPGGLRSSMSITVASCPSRPLSVTTALRLSTTTPMIGDNVTATFTVRNTAPSGCASFVARSLGAGGNGPGGWPSDVQDFPFAQNITIAPSASYSFSGTRAFAQAGSHSAWTAVMDQSGTWYTISPASGVQNQVSFAVQACAPRPVVTTSLATNPASPAARQTFRATYTITNTGCGQFAPMQIGVIVRGPDGTGGNHDMPWQLGIVLGKDQTYTYSQTRNLGTPGAYTLSVGYRDSNGEWKSAPAANASVHSTITITVGPAIPTPTPTPSPTPDTSLDQVIQAIIAAIVAILAQLLAAPA